MRNSTFPAVFGSVVRDRRQQQGFSQEKLAELADVHRNYIGLIERAERVPTIEIARRVAGALGLRLSTLVQEAEKECDEKKPRR